MLHKYFVTIPELQQTTVRRLTRRQAERLRRAGYIVEY